ncbi:MAG: deoxyribonuclease IV [Candidatus Micrarchaeia archaeon]
MNSSLFDNFDIKLGFHLSKKGSIMNPLKEAIKHRYGAFQTFLSNPRSWKNDPIDDNIIEEFKYEVKKSGIAANAHIPYLSNPSSPNEDVYKKSIEAIIYNLRICEALGIPLVVHMGSHLGKGKKYGINRLVSALSHVLDENIKATILLENSAGYNNSIGSTLEEIKEVLDLVDSKYVNVCIDTAHAFAAGYNIRSKEGVEAFSSKINESIKRDRIKLFHLNDSKYPLGSGLDRHWHIGKGYIGKEGFINFFSNPAFSYGIFIMETPVDDVGDDYKNWVAIKKIISKAFLYKKKINN